MMPSIGTARTQLCSTRQKEPFVIASVVSDRVGDGEMGGGGGLGEGKGGDHQAQKVFGNYRRFGSIAAELSTGTASHC